MDPKGSTHTLVMSGLKKIRPCTGSATMLVPGALSNANMCSSLSLTLGIAGGISMIGKSNYVYETPTFAIELRCGNP